jgi:hypothetical protein
MVITPLKLLPVLVVAGGLYAESDAVMDGVKTAHDVAKWAQTYMEMGIIARSLRTDAALGKMPDPAHFEAYLRKNGESLSGGDVGSDYWGTPYRLDLGSDSYAIRSAGADTQFDTEDDITIHGDLPRQTGMGG